MDLETALTTGGIAYLAIDRFAKTVVDQVVKYRRASGANVRYGLESYIGVMQEIYDLYRKLEEDGGFHSIRMLVAHNSGEDLDKTLFWKSTVLMTWQTVIKKSDEWKEQPLDYEYMRLVLKPVVENGKKHIRLNDLHPTGPLAAMCQSHGVRQMVTFLIRKKGPEIVYATIAFTSDDLTAKQINDIRETQIAIDKWLANGNSIFHMEEA